MTRSEAPNQQTGGQCFPGISKASWRLAVPFYPWVSVGGSAPKCSGQRSGRPLCWENVWERAILSVKRGFRRRAPDTFHRGGTGSPCPHHPASGSRDLALAGLGDYPHSLCLWPGRASFILSQRPGPQGLLCQSFCGRGKPCFLFSRQAQRATQSLPACRGPLLQPHR